MLDRRAVSSCEARAGDAGRDVTAPIRQRCRRAGIIAQERISTQQAMPSIEVPVEATSELPGVSRVDAATTIIIRRCFPTCGCKNVGQRVTAQDADCHAVEPTGRNCIIREPAAEIPSVSSTLRCGAVVDRQRKHALSLSARGDGTETRNTRAQFCFLPIEKEKCL